MSDANSRYRYLGEDDSGYICILKGLLDELIMRCTEAKIPYAITDERVYGKTIHVEFTGRLRVMVEHICDTDSAYLEI